MTNPPERSRWGPCGHSPDPGDGADTSWESAWIDLGGEG